MRLVLVLLYLVSEIFNSVLFWTALSCQGRQETFNFDKGLGKVGC